MGYRPTMVVAIVIAAAFLTACPRQERDGQGRSPDGGKGGFPDGGASSQGRRPTSPVKLVEIDLTKQRLLAYEGGLLVHEMSVSSGKHNKTPTGDFRIWRKHRRKDMKVGLPVLGKYYVLEDVPWIMYYYNAEHPKERGFALHGAWWHADFGKPASHGCVNLPVEDARELFFWTDPGVGALDEVTATEASPGTRVVVFGAAPPG